MLSEDLDLEIRLYFFLTLGAESLVVGRLVAVLTQQAALARQVDNV